VWLCWIVECDSSIGSVLVGLDEEAVADIIDHVKAVIGHISNNRSESRFMSRNEFGKVRKEECVAVLALAALRDIEDREPFVFRRLDDMETLRMRFVLVDAPIVCLRRAQAMVVDLVPFVAGRKIMPSLMRVIAAVKETIAKPGKVSHFQPLEVVFENSSGFYFQNVALQPI